MRTRILFCLFLFGMSLPAENIFAQAPNFSYTPNTVVFTINTPITPLSPTNVVGAGPVAQFAFGPGALITGATLNNPYGMSADPSGNIYVVNYGSNTVSKYSSTGTFISNNFFHGGKINDPKGITFDIAGNAYILSYNNKNNGGGNSNANSYVEQYNSAGVFQQIIVEGLGPASGITHDAFNHFYVAQGSGKNGSNTVSQFDNQGGLAFSTSGNTANPVNVEVDGEGNIYVLDNTNGNVTVFNPVGVYQSTIITGLTNALGMAIDKADNLYIGDTGTNTITVYTETGTLLTTIPGTTDPRGLTLDKAGDLYVSDFTNNTVKKYPPVGGYHLSKVLPAGLTFDGATGIFGGTPTEPFNTTTFTITGDNASGSFSTTVTLSCPQNMSAPDITYDPAINVFTVGVPVSIAPKQHGGIPTRYSIVPATNALLGVGGLSFDTNTGVISGTPDVTSVPTVYLVTAVNSFGSSTTDVSLASLVDNYWKGGKSGNDWNEPKNWNAKRVPVATDLASIGVVNYGADEEPIVSTNTNAYHVIFGPNAGTLTVQSGATLTINNILIVDDNATPTLQATSAIPTGVINVVPSAVIRVIGTGALTLRNPLTVTLQSDSTGCAQIEEMTTGVGSITGTVNVERFISGGTGYRGYRLLSSPVDTGATGGLISVNYLRNSCYVTGTTSTAGGFDTAPGNPNNPSLYLFRENLAGTNTTFTSGNFRGVNDLTTAPAYGIDVDGAGFKIYAGNGYLFFFRGDRNIGLSLGQENQSYVPTNTIITAAGSLNQGQILVKHWFTGADTLLKSTISGNPGVEGFNLVGNPYASSIDWDTYSTTLPDTLGIYAPGVAPFLYVLMPDGNYNIYKAGTGGLSTGGIPNSDIIPSGQGFFVVATGSTPSITFNESAKTTAQVVPGKGGNLFLGSPPSAAVSQYLHLFLQQDSVIEDGILINFNSSAKPQYVPGEDAPYLSGTGPASISSRSADNIALAINTLPLPKLIPLIIPLNVTANTDGTYQLNMAAIKNVPELYTIWLMDAYTKDSLDFRKNPVYTFNIVRSIGASYGAGRFSLVIRQNPALQVHLLTFTATKATNGVQVTWQTQHEQNYTYFTVERSNDDGKTYIVVGSRASDAGSIYSFFDSAPRTGANKYRLKIEDLNGTITYSNIVTITFGETANNNVMAYPNPTHGQVNLAIGQISHDPSYLFKIYNNLGGIVKSGSSNQVAWQTDVSDLLPGTYFILVLNKKTSSVVGKTSIIKL